MAQLKVAGLFCINNDVPVLPSMKRGLDWSVSPTAQPLVQQICLTSRRNRQVRGVTDTTGYIHIQQIFLSSLQIYWGGGVQSRHFSSFFQMNVYGRDIYVYLWNHLCYVQAVLLILIVWYLGQIY